MFRYLPRLFYHKAHICQESPCCFSTIKKIVLSQNIHTFGEQAFSRCRALSEIVGFERVQKVERNAIYGTAYLLVLPVKIPFCFILKMQIGTRMTQMMTGTKKTNP